MPKPVNRFTSLVWASFTLLHSTSSFFHAIVLFSKASFSTFLSAKGRLGSLSTSGSQGSSFSAGSSSFCRACTCTPPYFDKSTALPFFAGAFFPFGAGWGVSFFGNQLRSIRCCLSNCSFSVLYSSSFCLCSASIAAHFSSYWYRSARLSSQHLRLYSDDFLYCLALIFSSRACSILARSSSCSCSLIFSAFRFAFIFSSSACNAWSASPVTCSNPFSFFFSNSSCAFFSFISFSVGSLL
mmetsp:Transcript_69473/g.122635  ORF Transcript_69473/g.122635 Transcript_69473/m.122635 type:complete len:240 (-) Transcript_69473:210-929(-)